MNHSGQKLWGLLLVVDSFFVVIFGGAFAAKLYESWQAPSHEFFSPARSPKLSPENYLRSVPAIPRPPKAASPVTPAKTLTKSIAQAPTSPKPVKTQKNKYKEPQILPSRGPQKARGVAFHYYGKKIRRVFLVASFLHGGKKPLRKVRHGPWKAEVYLMPGNYRYQFMVDGKKILDPRNPRHKGRFSSFSLEK